MENWIIAIIATLAGVVVAFLLNLWRDIHHQREQRRQENMETHFEDIKGKITDRMSSMAQSLCITHYRLVFAGQSPVREKYDFLEEKEEYISFQIHFKELFSEWAQLNEKAIAHNKILEQFFSSQNDNNAILQATEELKPLQEDFSEFAKKLHEKMYDIERYNKIGKGKDFWYIKTCPKCKEIFS